MKSRLAATSDAFCVSPGESTRRPSILRSADASQLRLTLYVMGHTARSAAAIESLERICAMDLRGKYSLRVVDVLERPQLAEDQKILATPTLVKELPRPLRRVVGDLSNVERVLLGLDLSAGVRRSEEP